MKLFKKISLLTLTGIALTLTSCATSFSREVLRAADVDLKGAKSITVSAITVPGGKSTSKADVLDAVNYLQDLLEDRLYGSGYFQIVDKRDRRNVPDVYFDSGFTSFTTTDNRREIKVKNDDDEYEYYYVYSRQVKGSIDYKYVDSSTNRVIAQKSYSFSKTSVEKEDPHDLPSSFSIIKGDLDSFVNKIMKEIEPYIETKTYTLLKDKTKNPEFKVANDYAKKGFLEESMKAFSELFEKTQQFEAGYNAAIIMEALGYLDEAEESMNNLYVVFGEKKALNALKDIRSEKAKAAKLEKQAQHE